jgi:putative phosphoesterase
MRIGVISDTHGLLRPEALAALQGVELIVHAGDVGDPEILVKLKQIAPVFAVRGNVDTQPWAQELPRTTMVEADGANLYVLHNLRELDLTPAAAGCQAVITGHTHQPEIVEKNGVLYLNPGSAGPRRFSLPICLAFLDVENGKCRAEIVRLME